MIYKSIKPKKIASISSLSKNSNYIKNFKTNFEDKILNDFLNLEKPNNSFYVFSKINSLLIETEVLLNKNNLYKSLAWIYINPYIHSLENQEVYIAAEVLTSKDSKGIFKATIDFYAVDRNAKYTYNKYIHNKREISIPVNSIVYQVEKELKFKAYKKHNEFFFIRTNSDMAEVYIYIIENNYYTRDDKNSNSLYKINLIDNTNDILDEIVNVAELDSKAKNLDTYISFDKDYIRIDKKLFISGEKVIIKDLNGEIKDFIFKVYDLSRLNPSLSGKVRSIWLGDKPYISNTMV